MLKSPTFKKYLQLSKLEAFTFLTVLISSHLFFVSKEKVLSVLLCFSLASIFHFFKNTSHKKIMLMMSLFFISYWLLQIPYPFIGYLFWPIDQFVGGLILLVFSKVFLYQRTPTTWNFRFNKPMLLSAIGILLPTLICLVLYFFTHREISDKWPLPQMPIWAIPITVIFIALINGLREEFYFRFTLQDCLQNSASPLISILCASIAFGYMHFQNGYPAGGLGVILTTLFGIAIGIQFNYFNSASLSWITHSIADAVMFSIILFTKS